MGYWMIVRMPRHPNRPSDPATRFRRFFLDAFQTGVQGIGGAVQRFGYEIELRDGGFRLAAFRIDCVLGAGGRVRERVDDVVHAERASNQLLQFAAVFGSVEHGFAGRAEFRERLPACGQCFLLLVAVNAHAGTACHDEGHDHGKDDRPCLAGAGRLFSGLVLIIHTCHPLRTDSCHRSSSC